MCRREKVYSSHIAAWRKQRVAGRPLAAKRGRLHVAREFGELGSRYVALVERRAPHAPLAVLREVLDRHDEFGREVVAAILQQLVDTGIAKRNLLTQQCYRRRCVPRLVRRSGCIPTVDVEQRSLAVYDQAAV